MLWRWPWAGPPKGASDTGTADITVVLPLSINVSRNLDFGFLAPAVLSQGGVTTFTVALTRGGTMEIGFSQPTGNYTGNFPLTANYN